MSRWLRQSTSVDVPIGPFVDQTDGFTAEGTLTLTQPDIRLKKNGGAWAQKNAAQTLSHEENGYYEVTLDATDTNTLGLLRLAVNESGALPIFEDFLVVPANVWDSLFSTDLLQVDLTQWLGVTPLTLSSQYLRVVAEFLGSGAINDGALDTGSGLKPIRVGVAQAGAAGSITLDASASSVTDFYKHTRIYLTSGTGAGQSRLCTGYNGTTKVATIEPSWITSPASGTQFVIRDESYAPAIATGGIGSTSFAAGAINAAATASDYLAEINAEVDTALADYDAPTFAELDARTDAIEADTQDIQSRLPAALVGGRVDSSVGAIASGFDSYSAKIGLLDDDGGTADRYEVAWFKNGNWITAGVTSPTIQVVKSADGSNLFAATAMTEIGSLHLFKKTEGTNRIVDGASYWAIARATIDGSTREWPQVVGRDS